jgi:protoheme IX farnesyltransferase
VPYLVCALVLGAIFLARAVKMLQEYSDAWARGTFKFSILYLALLFAALLVDHYLV